MFTIFTMEIGELICNVKRLQFYNLVEITTDYLVDI